MDVRVIPAVGPRQVKSPDKPNEYEPVPPEPIHVVVTVSARELLRLIGASASPGGISVTFAGKYAEPHYGDYRSPCNVTIAVGD